MAQGKPVIATAYSGNLEFMSSDNSFLVDYRLVPVREGEYPDFRDQVWAEADVEHAASCMQSVFNDVAAAQTKGLRAAECLARDFSFSATGRQIQHRFQEIAASR